MTDEFSADSWERRYRDHAAGRHQEPSPHLVAAAAARAPGAALEAGCGEGANAIWLAEQGWRVTAVDVSPTAISRGEARARELGPSVTERLGWVVADLTLWRPPIAAYDLVSSHYVHPDGLRAADLLRRLAPAVAAGGTLLLVDHAPGDEHAATHTPVEELASLLPGDEWETDVAEIASGRRGAHGSERILHDTVLRARRR